MLVFFCFSIGPNAAPMIFIVRLMLKTFRYAAAGDFFPFKTLTHQTQVFVSFRLFFFSFRFISFAHVVFWWCDVECSMFAECMCVCVCFFIELLLIGHW